MAVKMQVIRPFLLEGKRVYDGQVVEIPSHLVYLLMEKGVVGEVAVFGEQDESGFPPESCGNDMAEDEVDDESGD